MEDHEKTAGGASPARETAIIETERLRLRPYTTEDLDALAAIVGDPITMSFWPQPFTRENTSAWIERSLSSYRTHGFGRWPVILREEGRMVGDCGLFRSTVNGHEVNDLGYILHHPWWRRGYAIEAARAVVRHAFDVLGLDAIHANMAHDNERSRLVAERLGMTKVEEFDNERNRGIRTLLYELRRNEAR